VILQPVLIPARRFEVEVSLGPHDGLSLIEQYILRAVALGVTTVEGVARVLSLSDRMVLDVAVDLLARQLIEVGDGGVLGVNERVRSAMGDGSNPTKDWFLGFQSARLPEPRTVALVQDLVAGEVFSLARVPADRERLPRMPNNDAIPALEEIPLATLVAAVTNAMRASRRSRGETRGDDLRDEQLPRDARILGVRLARAGAAGESSGAVAVRGMWILAQVAVTNRGADEPPRVAIVEPTGMAPHVRRSISTVLDDLWRRNVTRGEGQFFARLHAYRDAWDEERPPRFVSPVPLLQRASSLVADSSTEPQTAHEELSDLARAVDEAGEHLGAFAAPVELVDGAPLLFRGAALDALRTAEAQVVLACPWIGQIERDATWQDALRDATARGIKVVLVWGINADGPQEDPTWHALRGLARDGDGGLVFAGRGAGSHAKLIVCDASWALVTSCNYLNSAPDRTRRELGLRVRTTNGTVPLALQSVLGWARRLMPDYMARDRCVDAPALFGLREMRPDVPVARQTVAPPNPYFGSVGIDAWKQAWVERLAELRTLTSATSSAVLPVFDGEHRDLLVRAIEHAQERILIESHRVSGYGLTEPVLTALIAARARNVQVVIRHGIDSTLEPGSQERLDALRASGATVLAVDTHAKVLVHDHWAVVSSFNFLSADPGLRGARELGLRTNDAAVVASLWNRSMEA
jgi:hypothetical protein